MRSRLCDLVKSQFQHADNDDVADTVDAVLDHLCMNKPEMADNYPYAARCAYNKYMHAMKKRKRQRPLDDAKSLSTIESPDAALDADILHNAIENLPQMERDVVNHCHIEELTYEEAAERLHININTLKKHLKSAMRKLRRYFGAPPSNNRAKKTDP